MKVGDLVMHNGKEIGIIEYIFTDDYGDPADVCVLFEDGEFQVDSRNLEVINESR